MSEYKDFFNMIEIISYALEIQGRAEESFRRSARNATSEVARGLFSEIASDFGQNREKLQVRKHKLLEALHHLRSFEQAGDKVGNRPSIIGDIESSGVDQNASREIGNSITARDPVCDMQVKKDECKYISVRGDMKFWFCCEDCQKAFDLAPEKYIRVWAITEKPLK